VYDSEDPLGEFNPPSEGVHSHVIAKHVAGLLPDHETSSIQVGIGSVLGSIGEAVKDKPLRIWSEMGSDWMIPLVGGDQPRVTDRTVSFIHGRHAAIGLGNRVHVDSSAVVNNPERIAAQPNIVAVNNALEVDLTGSANAEKINGRVISSPGGQPDFMEGA